MLIKRIDHVGYAVEDLDESIRYHQRLYGTKVAHRQTLESDGVEEALLSVGESYIQLLAPISEGSPVARFLSRHGPGLHHVAYGVADVAAALEHMRQQGVRLVDEHPRPGSRGSTVAFLHPKGAQGVLVELVQARLGGVETSTGGVPGF